jgi:Na+/proline symporter
VVALSALINAGLGFLFMLVGVALFVYYMQPGGAGMPLLESEDQILPHFVSKQAAGIGLVGLMLAGLFAAAMSTVDSGINGVASVIVYDWLGGKELSLHASRTLTIGLGGLVILAAIAAPAIGSDVIGIITTVAGTLLGGLMAVFLLGMFVPRANAPGVLIGLAAGAVALFFIIYTKQTQHVWLDDPGIPAWALAILRFAAGVPAWWYGVFTVFPTLLVGALASLFFHRPAPEALAGTVWGETANSSDNVN